MTENEKLRAASGRTADWFHAFWATSSRRAGPRERSRESLGIIMSASLQLRRVIVD